MGEAVLKLENGPDERPKVCAECGTQEGEEAKLYQANLCRPCIIKQCGRTGVHTVINSGRAGENVRAALERQGAGVTSARFSAGTNRIRT